MSATENSFRPPQANILMVDDRPANLFALEAVLEPLGHRLVPALSGEEALNHLVEEEFAVILMDVQMPRLDGYETVALIKQRESCRRIPILFISAINQSPEHVLKGYSCGAVDYILKPIEPFVLRVKVSAFLDLYLKERQLRAEQEILLASERNEQRRLGEERFRSFTESMPLCVWATDAGGHVQYCNRSWMQYSGMTVEESAGLGVLKAIHPEQRERVQEAWKRAVRAGRPFESDFLLRRKSDGSYRWHLCRAMPDRDGADKIGGWIVTATDIDAQKRAEEDRARVLAVEQASRELAEAANTSKDQFLAILSHELRNPLNAILGWTRMLRWSKLDPERVERALSAIERNAEAQTKLVEDLLDVSRIVTGKLKVQRRAASFGGVVNAALDTVRPQAEVKGVRLSVAIEEDVDQVLADVDRLQQVVWNLLSNAIKFTPRGGSIAVEVKRAEREVELRIQDSGAGIAPDLLPHIFDHFWQADSTSTRTHSGLGLGLAIARHLVKLHGGIIRAESDGVGKGAAFFVRLPTYSEAGDRQDLKGSFAAPARGPSVELPRLTGLKVLFVDDQADARELMSELLQLYGAQVVVADSAATALKALDDLKLDVLVSDIGMPNEDGYALIRQVRSRPNERGGDIPALAVTGFATSFDNQRALSEGFQAYLAKPVDPRALLSIVVQLGRGRQGAAESGPAVATGADPASAPR